MLARATRYVRAADDPRHAVCVEALDRLQDGTHELFIVLPEPPDMSVRWHDLASRYAVHGRGAHDTRLVALMLAHGVAAVLTLNPADFARYAEITCLAPEGL
jgi:predicted nucleic acid-binding protein